MTSSYEICLVTVGDKTVAEKITEALLEGHLAACVSTINGVVSKFYWKDKVDSASEILLIIKTKSSLRKDVMQCVKINHNYETPEIIFIPIVDGSQDYLDWIGANTEFSPNAVKADIIDHINGDLKQEGDK